MKAASKFLMCTALVAAALPASAQTVPAPAPAATVHPEIWPQAKWPYKADPAVERRIADLLRRMTLEEKVGQVVQGDIASLTPADVKKYHLGSVLNGGNSAPNNDEFAPASEWLKLADQFYAASVDKSDGGVGIPVIWGTDAVHGHSNIVGATLFPHNVGLGAMHDPAVMRKIAQATAAEIRATGIEWTFAPTITVPQDVRWGRAYEGYSSDPKLVASYVTQFIEGLQGAPGSTNQLKGPYVLASTKHFLADGGTFGGQDQGDARIPETVLRDIHGTPYVAAINAGVQTVMASFSSWNGEKITGHKGLMTDVLKKRMGFGGFIVSDWNAHGQVAGCTNATCARAINAGLDMYMAPDSWKPIWESLVAQVKSGQVPMSRLDDAVANVLRVKIRAGLFEAGAPSTRPLSGKYELLGSAEHRAIAREAVAKSLVLLKNNGSLLPLKPGARILVAGDGADDVARQSGGWTLTWQGTGIDKKYFPGATSLYQGIDGAVKAAGGSATLSPDGSFTGAKPDAAIVVFGETQYAEFQGDIKTLQLKPEQRAPIETMRKLKAQGIPVVAVMLTGRPLFVNPAINASDAFVVAWLPGSEGAGVADVLFRDKAGKVQRDFTGTLSFAWPATADALGKTLFPIGYGLKGASGTTVPALSEDAGVVETDAGGVFMDKGLPSTSWSLEVGGAGTGGNTRITTVPAQSGGGRVKVTATDHGVQEGARRFQIDGSGPAEIVLRTQSSVDLTRETNGDVLLLATMRVDEAPTAEVKLAIRTGAGGGNVTLGRMEQLPVGEWKTLGVPLKCFNSGNVNMNTVDAPFILSTTGRATVSIARVALGTVADVKLTCAK
ncbi:glycoside hydrolase family 3 protein [Sphingomonas sp. CFBP 13720]|uniref:glycoside hydrolase family 3 protein n=1 Tax=Sphingomonas sp. CFBP 13720 TaxID=2775302 RepID=UPI001784F4A0|nr:glycoside hydrolase family 3 protein [Sphingomonas sp. CFBP 13720]MBD8678600.1 exo 1,3/1,4-beta-D-glucan glucohydrolase [Sphingomonas sp. CFBP 13720]